MDLRLIPLSGLSVIEAVDRGRDKGRTQRALALLSVALPNAGLRRLAALPLGKRDRLLLRLRKQVLGPTFYASSPCPGCGTRRDFAVEVDDVLAAGPQSDVERKLSSEGYKLRLRPLDSRDLETIVGLELEAARQQLLRRAIIKARRDGERVTLENLPETVLKAIEDRLEALDPLAVVPLAIQCESCGGEWRPTFDVATFVWLEFESVAERLLYEVQTLAAAYGWNEAEVLAMSSHRRRYYIDRTPVKPSRRQDQADTDPERDAIARWR